MPRRLFIGGFADGKWFDIDNDPPYFEVAQMSPPIDNLPQESSSVYKLQSINFGSEHVEQFYVAVELTQLEAFRKLLAGYYVAQSH